MEEKGYKLCLICETLGKEVQATIRIKDEFDSYIWLCDDCYEEYLEDRLWTIDLNWPMEDYEES